MKTFLYVLLLSKIILGFVPSSIAKEVSVLSKKAVKDSELKGTWAGHFTVDRKFMERYGFMALASKEVKESKKITFQLHLSVEDATIKGFTTEANVGEDQFKNPIIRASIQGKINEKRIEFTKTYDTLPLIIEYKGEFSSDHKSVSGTYSSKDLTGPFEMNKISL